VLDHIFVGLDIGGTKTAVLVVDQDSKILSRHTAPTQITDPKIFVTGIAAAIDTALQLAGVTRDQIQAIGAGIPGHIVQEKGEVHMAVNLNLTTFPIGPKLSEIFKVPIALENDVRAAAFGAYEWMQTQRDASTMAYISIGTGISAGVVLNGRLYHGHTGMAVEIGHVQFEQDGPLCACGMHGCLEALASGPAIARQYQELFPGPAIQAVTAKEVYQAAAEGQPQAVDTIQLVSQILARAVNMMVNMYDVEVVVFGGGVSSAGAPFLNPIIEAVARIRQQSDLARMLIAEDAVLALPPGHSAATWGAIKLAQQI